MIKAVTSSAAFGAAAGMERATGDYMGMLATVMNALAMQSALEQKTFLSGDVCLPISAVCEPYICRRAMRHMERAGMLSLLRVQEIRFSPLTQQQRSGRRKWCDALLKAHVLMVYMILIRKRTRMHAV